ncbi:MAG: GTPase [archaeon]|nr:GTPase [archaeon]
MSSIEALAEKAAADDREYAEQHPEKDPSSSEFGRDIHTIPDGSRKAYFREFKKVVEDSDVILEVLDARDPLGYRCPDIEKLIMKKDPNKKIILVLNKVDLIPRQNMLAWLKYLRHSLPTIAFKCSTQTQRSHLGQATASVTTAGTDLLQGRESVGAETLLQLLKNYSRSADIKTSITVGIIGYPNTGKSSLINSLKRTRSVGVGATPGFTKKTQLIHLDKNIRLLDSPGIVFSSRDANSADIQLRNCVKVEQIDDPIPPVELILKRCSHEQLLVLYRIPDFRTVREFLANLAVKRGMMKKGGGQPNITAAARAVLQDWNSGRIQYYTVPPEVDKSAYISSAIVAQWGESFFDKQLLQAGDDQALVSLEDEQPQASSSSFRIESAPVGVDGTFVSILGGDDDDDYHTNPAAARGQLVIRAKELGRKKDQAPASKPSSSVQTPHDDKLEASLNTRQNKTLQNKRKAEQKRLKKNAVRSPAALGDDADDSANSNSDDAFDFNTDFVSDQDSNEGPRGMNDSDGDLNDEDLLGY